VAKEGNSVKRLALVPSWVLLFPLPELASAALQLLRDDLGRTIIEQRVAQTLEL